MLLARLKRQQLERIMISSHSLSEEICPMNRHVLIFKIQTELCVHKKTTKLIPNANTKTVIKFSCFSLATSGPNSLIFLYMLRLLCKCS